MQRCTPASSRAQARRDASIIAGAAFERDSFRLRPNQIRGAARRTAFFMSCLFHDEEIFDSDEPCAIAMMFTPSRPKVLNVRPPSRPCRAYSRRRQRQSRCADPAKYAPPCGARGPARTVPAARPRCASHPPSDDEADIILRRRLRNQQDVGPHFCRRRKCAPTTSGRPTIPGPPSAISETSLIAVSAFAPPPLLRPCGVIFVPAFSGAKLLRIQTGISCGITRAESSDAKLWLQNHAARRLRDMRFQESYAPQDEARFSR